MNMKARITGLEGRHKARTHRHALPLVILTDSADLPGQKPGESLEAACTRLGFDYDLAKRRRTLRELPAGSAL